MGLCCSKEAGITSSKKQTVDNKQRYTQRRHHAIYIPEEPKDTGVYKFCGKKNYRNYCFVEKWKLIKQLGIKSILNIDIKFNNNNEIEFEESNKIKQNLDHALRRNELSKERKESLFYDLLYIMRCFTESGIENIIKFKSNVLFNENNEMVIGDYLKQELSNEYTNPINSFCMIIYELTDDIKYKSFIRNVMIDKVLLEELNLVIESFLDDKYVERKVEYFNKYMYNTIYHPLSERNKKTVENWISYYKKSNDTEMNLYGKYFSDSLIEYFSLKIPSLSNLTKLNIICNINYKRERNDEAIIYLNIRINNYGMRIFANNLHYIPELVDIGLENNRSGEDGLKYLFQQFSSISKIENMSISECETTDDNLIILNNNLEFLTSLKELNMECRGRSFRGFEAFAKDIYKCKSLELLNITLLDFDKTSSLKVDRIFRGYISKSDLHFTVNY